VLSEAALAAHRDGKLRVTIGRASDYFGPWGTATNMGGLVFGRLLQGKAAQIAGSAKMPHTQTYIPDFARGLVILGERTEADGQAWHVPNDMPRITQGEMIHMVASEAGVSPRTMLAGRVLLSVMGLFVRELRETIELLYEFEQPIVVDSGKFEKAFGMKATPMATAIHETTEWYKAHLDLKHEQGD